MKTVTIIDTFGFFFRSYFALPPLRNTEGFPTGLLTGFITLIDSLKKEHNSEYLVFALDTKGDTFRNEIDPNYKANRSAPPPELTMQLPVAIEWIDKMGYKTLGMSGYEADDMIATVTKLAKDKGYTVRVVSHDKDLYQLIEDGKVTVVDAIKRKSVDEKACYEKYGVTPAQFIDYQSILGDSADNVPGVKGIGKVGAEKLLKEYGDLDNIFAHIQEVKGAMQKKLLESKVYPAWERLKDTFIKEKLFEPTIIYGYYPCRSDDQELFLFSPDEGWHNESQVNREPLDEKVGRAVGVFNFPRQRRKPYRALSDFFRHERDDVVALTCVSAGAKITEYERSLYEKGEYLEYNLVHGLGVELAEALAEVAHKQIRLDLNIASDDEGHTLRDVRMNRYRGARYSFGYPACPDLEQSRVIFDLLKPEEFGIELSETFQIHPEQSTTAIVVHHPEATYYAV